MIVAIKKLEVSMQVKTNGIELEVKDSGNKQVGDCYATSSGLTWCRGKTTRKNSVRIKWADLATLCKSKESLEAAIAAAKNG